MHMIWRRKRLGHLSLWALWVGISTLSALLAQLIFLYFVHLPSTLGLLVMLHFEHAGNRTVNAPIVASSAASRLGGVLDALAIMGIVAGAIGYAWAIGWAQWRLLHRLQILQAGYGWWRLAAQIAGVLIAVGLLIANLDYLTPSYLMAEGLAGAIFDLLGRIALYSFFGLLAGAAQWKLLVRYLHPRTTWWLTVSALAWGIGWPIGSLLANSLSPWVALPLPSMIIAAVTGVVLLRLVVSTPKVASAAR
jgi:hypothetical protein